MTTAARRYLWRILPLMALYAAMIFGLDAWKRSATPPSGAWLYAAALAAALPILGVIWAIGRYLVEEADEYQRMLTAQACLWAAGLTLAAATAWGFLEDLAGAPHVPAYDGFIVFCAALGLVQVLRKVLRR